VCPQFGGDTSSRFECAYPWNFSGLEGKTGFIDLKVSDGFGEGLDSSDENFVVGAVSGNGLLQNFSDGSAEKELEFESGFYCFDNEICPQKPWWDFAWNARNDLSVEALGRIALGEKISFSLNTEEMIASGKMKPDCSDLRVVFEHKTEIPRLIDGCNSYNSKISFNAQATQFFDTVDAKNYSIYYSNSAAGGAGVFAGDTPAPIQPKVLLFGEKVAGQNSFMAKKTLYIELPKNAQIVDAKLDLQGLAPQNYCFADSFNDLGLIDMANTTAQNGNRLEGGDMYFENSFGRTFLAAAKEDTGYGNWGFMNLTNVFIAEPGIWTGLEISGWAQDSYYVNLDWSASFSGGIWTATGKNVPYSGGPECHWSDWGVSRGEDYCRFLGNTTTQFNFNNYGTATSRGFMCGKQTGFGSYDPAYHIYLSQFAPLSTVQSKTIDSSEVISASLDANVKYYGQSADFFVSNDNGSNWVWVPLKEKISLPAGIGNPGLKWKALMHSNNVVYSPRLNSVNMCYTAIGFPSATEVGVGDGSKINWDSREHIGSSQTVNLDSSQIQDYIENNSGPNTQTVLVPIVFFGGEPGKISVSNLNVRYFLVPNRPPELSLDVSPAKPIEGDTITVVANGTDPDNDQLNYSIDSGLFAQKGNVFSWKTISGDAGEHSFSFTVTDGNLSETKTITVVVSKPGRGEFSCSIDSDCNDNDQYTFDSCLFPSLTGSICSHQKISCLGDADCVDALLGTKSVCVNVGTIDSFCQNLEDGCDAQGNDSNGSSGCISPAVPEIVSPINHVLPQCSDTIDNDNDGFIDLNDAGCHGNALENDENSA
ncbi:MAG: hypothetical protein AABW85_03020, partial [archaeon]